MGGGQAGAAARRARRGATPQGLPVDRVEGDADRERDGLDDGLDGRGDAEGDDELHELLEEDRRHHGRQRVAPAAEQRGAAEHHHGHRDEQEAVALEGARLGGDAGEHDAGQAVEQLRVHVRRGLVGAYPQADGAGGPGVGPDRLEPAAGDRAPHQHRTTTSAARAKKTAFGTPALGPPVTDASSGVVMRGRPPEMPRLAPYSRALVPSVAMIGLSRRTPTRTPLSRPAPSANTHREQDRRHQLGVVPVRDVGDDARPPSRCRRPPTGRYRPAG